MNDFENEKDTYNRMNSQPAKRVNGFEVAACICGVLSLLALCTGIFAISIGCLGLVFALLYRRKGVPMSTPAFAGMCMSLVGIILGITITVFVTVNYILPMLNDPAAMQELVEYYKSVYGYDFSEVLIK